MRITMNFGDDGERRFDALVYLMYKMSILSEDQEELLSELSGQKRLAWNGLQYYYDQLETNNG